MKLLAHFLAADVRRFRLTIAVWVAIVVTATVLEGMAPLVAGDSRSFSTVVLAANLVGVAHLLLVVALVPLIVQAHPLVGSDAFWMTRPVPPFTLLLSKLILLASLLVVVPLLCDLALMGFHRVPPGRMTLVALQISLVRSLVLVILMSAAAITRNLARYAVLGGAFLLSLAVLVSVVSWIALSRIDDAMETATLHVAVSGSYYAPMISRGPDQTSALAGTLVFMAAGLALLGFQYRRRSVIRSVIVGVAGTGLAWLVASVWPWPLLHQRLVVPDWAKSPSALQLSADPLSVALNPIHGGWSERPRILRAATASVRLTNMAPDWFAMARLDRASLELDSAVHVMNRRAGHTEDLPADEENEPPLHRAVRHVLGVRVILGSASHQDRAGAAVILIARDDELARYRDLTRERNTPGTYRGQFLVDLRHLSIAAILPLEPRAGFQESDYSVTLNELRRNHNELTIRTTSSQASTVFDRRPQPAYLFYLRNQQRSEAVPGMLMPVREQDFVPFFGFPFYAASSASGFDAAANLIRFPDYGNPKGQLDDEWLRGGELVIVRMTTEGSVSRTLQIEGVQLSEPPPTK